MSVPPLLYPFAGTYPVTAAFGEAGPWWSASGGRHTGMDFGMPSGTPVRAAAAGTVERAAAAGDGYGLAVVLRSAWGQQYYGHLSETQVRLGQQVGAGQQIGLSGATGNVTGPHLHFEIRVDGAWVDPAPHLGVAPPANPSAAPPPSAQPTLVGWVQQNPLPALAVGIALVVAGAILLDDDAPQAPEWPTWP